MRISPFVAVSIVISFTACNAKQYKTKVAIVGAGAAGISAASRLDQKGETDFLIIDAQSFIGGRVQHQSFGDKSVELGANWIYGKGANPIYKLATRHGLMTTPNDKRDVAYYDTYGPISTQVGHELTDAFEQVMEDMVLYAENRLSRNQVDLSSRTALRMLDWQPDTPLKSAVEYFAIDWELAEPAEVASLDYATGTQDMTVGTFPFGNEFVIDHRGFNYIIKQEASRYLRRDDDRLLLNTLVTHIDYSNDDVVKIKTNNSHEILADYVICTFSLGVLQSDLVQFMPKHPQWKKEAIYSFHMTTYTKIFMRFDHQFWGDWQFALYADNNRTKPDRGYIVWQNLNAPGYFSSEERKRANKYDYILMVTVTYKDAERIEKMADTEITSEIMVVLQNMFPDVTVPRPIEILVPRWHSNPLFRGSYSNWPIGMLTEHHDNLRAPLPARSAQPRIWFSGEAMSEDYGYLHGAWIEGIATANKILECIHHQCPYQEYHDTVTGCGNNPSLKFQKNRKKKNSPSFSTSTSSSACIPLVLQRQD